MPPSSDKSKRRAYNSPLRKQQAAETQAKIVDAGVALVQELPSWDWRNLTFKAVSERAGISERTVYRYYANEGLLRDAVIQRLVEDSGVDLFALSVENFSSNLAKMYESLSRFAARLETIDDPRLLTLDERRRESLSRAVTQKLDHWDEVDQQQIMAILDTLWSPANYERFVFTWGMDTERATQTITWLTHLVTQAVENNQRPSDFKPPTD